MKRIILTTLIAILTSWAMADDVTITVQAPSSIEAGDQFRVRFTVNSQNVSNFVAPDFKGFEVIYGPATSRQSNIQIVNGHTTQNSSITFTYVLLGSKPGTYTLEAASIQCNGQTIKSKPLTIRVSKIGAGGGNSQSNQQGTTTQPVRSSDPARSATGTISSNELFMTATASRTNVYQQEAILVTYKLYTLVNLTQLDGKLPTLDGFQIQEIPLPRNKEFQLETYNGRNYHTVVWSQYVLFPQKSGQLVIPPVSYEGVVVQPNRNIDPIDAFFNGSSGMIELKKRITTPALTINVSPLPTEPEGFSRAVGTFSITSSINTTDVKTDDAITLKINISGTGNMKLINTPEVKFPKDFETYDPKITDNFNLTRNGLSGSKTFEYLIVPRHAGTYEIPATPFIYFDTESRSYKTISTQPYTIHVAKGKGDSSQAVSDFSSNQQDVRELNQDIRFIHTNDVTLHKQGEQFFSSTRLLAIYLIPLILFILISILGRKQIADNANITATRGRKANKVARKRLKLSAKLLQEHKQDAFYDEVLKALYGYTADKLAIPQEHLNKDNVQSELKAKGVEEDIINLYITTLNDCEFARYAPGDSSANMENIYAKVISLISKLEDNIRK